MAGVILVTVNPGLPGERGRICAEAVARGRRHGGDGIPRQSDAGDGAGAAIPRCPELREIICFDRWDAFLASGDDGQSGAADRHDRPTP